MKKTLRTILAGAVALLAVSCYDDSALNGKIDALDQRLTEVEAALDAEVGGIADLLSRIETLEGKVAAIKVETKDGVTTLTLSNESSVVLSKDGVITIKDGNWATVAADGTVTVLPYKVGHDLDFKVENGELKISYDEGKTYEATGVKVSEYTAHVIGNVVPSADGKSVAVTIGDQTLTLPLVSSAVATLGLSRDSFYLRYGATKTVDITATNLTELYVMNEPDGWDAAIEGNVLTIVAPSSKAVGVDAADAKGLVLVHATNEDGKCVVAKLEVSTGKGLTVEINGDVLTFTNAYAAEEFNYWGDPMGFNFTNYAVGITPAEHFESADKYIAEYIKYDPYMTGVVLPQYEANGFMYNNYNMEFKPYEDVTYEVDVVNLTISELVKWLMWNTEAFPTNDIETGVEYVIWCAPADMQTGYPDPSLLEYVTYARIKADSEPVNVTAFGADLNMNLAGADMYFVGIADPAQYGMTIEEYMSQASEWSYMVQGQVAYITDYYVDGTYSGETAVDLTMLNYGPLSPNTTYYYYVLPYKEGAVYDNYESQCAPYIKSFTTLPLVPGTADSVAAPTLKTSLGYTSVSAKITAAEGTYVYYSYVTSEELLAFESDAAKVDYVIENCYTPASSDEPAEATKGYLDINTSTILLYAVVNEKGEYLVKDLALTTNSYPTEVNSALTATVSDVSLYSYMVKVKINPAEGTTVYYKFMTESQLANYTTDQDLVNYVCAGYSLTEAESVSTYSSKTTLVMVVVDADNKYNLVKESYEYVAQ